VVEAARRYFRGQDVVVEPRKMFVAPGRALVFADDPAGGEALTVSAST
jgi:hypothetical protein